MAAFFLVLAVLVGVVIGDAVVANTSAGSIQLFDQTITGFSQGQLLVIAAGAGFVFASLVFLAWGSSRNRRRKRELRRGMEGRIAELERENAGLRDGVDRDLPTTRLGEMAGADDTGETTQVSRRIFARRAPDRRDERATSTAGSTTRRNPSDQAERERANNR